VQRGRHDELLAQEGLYRRIYDLELKDQEEALGRERAAAAAAVAGNGHRNGARQQAASAGREAIGTPAGGGAT